jgi:hypothetical protein
MKSSLPSACRQNVLIKQRDAPMDRRIYARFHVAFENQIVNT